MDLNLAKKTFDELITTYGAVFNVELYSDGHLELCPKKGDNEATDAAVMSPNTIAPALQKLMK